MLFLALSRNKRFAEEYGESDGGLFIDEQEAQSELKNEEMSKVIDPKENDKITSCDCLIYRKTLCTTPWRKTFWTSI